MSSASPRSAARSSLTASLVLRSWRWAGAGAVSGLLLALALSAPAVWVTQAVSQWSQGQVLLDNVRGTVWNGSARLSISGGAGSQAAATLPQRVSWQLRPGWDGLSVRVDAPCCTPEPLQLQATARWGGVVLSVADGRSRWPAALLSGLGAPWNTLAPEGILALSTQGLTLQALEQRLTVGGRIEVELLNLSSSLSTLRPMGSYRLAIDGGSPTTLQLQTIEGSLQLSGSGQWLGSRLRFNGVATAEPGREAALSNLLNLIGRRSGARSILTVG